MFKQKHSANFETESIKSSLWDYFNAFILVTGDITVTPDNNTYDAFRNCILFSWCKTEINDLFKQDNFTKFEAETIKSSLWDYFHRFTSTARDIMVTADNKTDVAVTNWAQFSTCETPNDDLFKQNNFANFETESIKSNLWDYFDAFILIAGDVTVTVIIMQMLHLHITHHFLHVRHQLIFCLNKTILLTLRQKVLNHVFEIILTH